MPAELDIPTRNGDQVKLPVAPGVLVRKGGVTAMNASGFAAPPGEAGADFALGWAEETADNRKGKAGPVTVRLGVCLLANSPVHPLDASHVGGPACFAGDAEAATEGVAAGGTVFSVDETGVWIDFTRPVRPGGNAGDTYSREEIDRKLAEAALGGTVDLDAYATDAEVEAAIAAALNHTMRPIGEAEIDDIIYGG